MTENYENWEQEFAFSDSGNELKMIQKNIRRRNYKVILTSVALVILLLLCAVHIFIPAAEKLYWDPTACNYLENITDLELTMVTYNNLFGHGQHIMAPIITKTGFADYSIETTFVEWETITRLTALSRRSTTLTQGTLNADSDFWIEMMEGSFIREYKKDDLHINFTNEESEKILRTLPEYIQVLASVTFTNDLSMKQLQILTEENRKSDAHFLWAILRTSDPSEYVHPCGIQLTEYIPNRYQTDFWKDTAYPNLFPDRGTWTPKSMEQHIISSLQFSADQFGKGTGILPPGENEDYYETTLGYLEDNGIKTYGCYVLATPQVLLEMIENGTVSYIYLIDARIGI